MDRPLSADRYGGGGGGGYHGGGGGYNNNNNRRYRGGNRGRNRNRGHQPYGGRRRGGGGGGGGQRNRFDADHHSQNNQDPKATLLRQITSMISRAGEFKNIPEVGSDPNAGTTGGVEQIISLRPVEAITAKNVSDLVPVTTSGSADRMETFFKYSKESTDPQERAGEMCHIVVSCAAALPLQTPCYAALTLAFHEHVRMTPPFGPGFATRCVDYATWHIGRDIDSILLKGASSSPSSSSIVTTQAACRVKLLLRYLALLGKMGIIQVYPQEEGADVEPTKQTLVGILRGMLEAARIASQPPHSNPGTCFLLLNFVLSTLPYLTGTVPQEQIDDILLQPAEALYSTYRSAFQPGTGSTAILLKGGQAEGDEEDDDDDDDDDEEEDDEEGSGPICDSMQDLYRISQRLKDQTRFALPSDAPWRGLTQTSTPNPESGETETRPVTYSDDATYLSLSECRSLWFLTSGPTDADGSKTVGNVKLSLAPVSLDGVVFGRLPIFGSPRDPDDDDDEDDDDEMDDASPKNEQLEAFKENFGLLDRYFLGDTLRDCLICHEPVVTSTGVTIGGAKQVAEELLSVAYAFTGDKPSKGLEYAIVETIFGLIAQSHEGGSLNRVFLSQVLSELVKSKPTLFPTALITGVLNLFDHYLPSLVPSTRNNFSGWFAFHLINTGYQWPKAYWKAWEPYATSSKASSRGDFMRNTIHLLVDNLSEPKELLASCFAETPSYASEFFPRPTHISLILQEDDLHFKLEEEVNRRVWDVKEDPKELLEFLESGPVTEMISNGALIQQRWVLSRVLTRVFCSPAKSLFAALKESLTDSSQDEDQMEDDSNNAKDPYSAILEVIDRYGETVDALLKKESTVDGDLDNGRALVLQEIEGLVHFNGYMLRAIVGVLLKKDIVNGISVLRWSLGGSIVPNWSMYAMDALSFLSGAAGDDSGMVVDGTQAESDARKARTDLLQFAVNRVRPLLSTHTEKRLEPLQVNLVEGTKALAVYADSMNKKTSLTDDGSIKALADLCVGAESSPALAILKTALESI